MYTVSQKDRIVCFENSRAASRVAKRGGVGGGRGGGGPGGRGGGGFGGGFGGGLGASKRSKYVDAGRKVVRLIISSLELLQPLTPESRYHAVVSGPKPEHSFANGTFLPYSHDEQRASKSASIPVL